MFFKYTYLFFLVTLVFGSPLEPYHGSSNQLQRRNFNDFKTISDIMLALAKQLDELKAKTALFDGDAEKGVPLLESSDAVYKAITDGTAKIQSTSAMGLADSIQILNVEMTLLTATQGVCDGFIEKKPLFVQASIDTVVFEQLQKQAKASQGMVDAIVGKLPSYVPGAIGKTAAQPILDALNKAVAAFTPAGQTPPAPPTSGSSGSSSPSSPAPAPASAPKAPKGKGKGGRPPALDMAPPFLRL